MALAVGAFLTAWAIGYGLGFKLRQIRNALYAA